MFKTPHFIPSFDIIRSRVITQRTLDVHIETKMILNAEISKHGWRKCLFVIALVLGTGETTGSAGGDETDFATGRSVTTNSRRHTDVLMVTTTVRMLNRVHSNTTNLGPRVPLSLVLEVSSAGFQQRLIDTTATGDDSHHSAIGRWNGFLRARWQFDF